MPWDMVKALALIALLAAPMATQATVIYEFFGTGFSGQAQYSFVYEVQDFLTGYVEVLPADLSSCSVQVSFAIGEYCDKVILDALASTVQPNFASGGMFGGGSLFRFAPDSFSVLGTHASTGGPTPRRFWLAELLSPSRARSRCSASLSRDWA